ncbi:MAG: hypothetical protein II452_07200 [Paludibacteraceae bacterium]|nr:hypothetical protein [Paludibacteraceae bacterium]
MQEENSKIPFSIRLKEDGSYAFAEAKLTNTVSSLQIAQKAADYAGVQISPKVVDALVSAYLTKAKEEVAEGNRVYIPCDDGNGIALYAILDKATLRQGDKDSNGETIAVNAANLSARAAQFKVRLGAQVSTNFADITKHASLHFNGEVTPIRNNGSTPSNGGGNNGGDPDENVIG